SFDYPTDTFLPGAKIGYNRITKIQQSLTCWRSPNDPAKGLYSLKLDPDGDEFFLESNQNRYWSSGTWNGSVMSRLPEIILSIYSFSYVKNENESYFTYDLYNSSAIYASRLVMELSGEVMAFTWTENTQTWFLVWSLPRMKCEVYGYCGPFGVCDENNLPLCRCFNGFIPRSPNDWNNMRNFSGGCVRKKYLQCGDEVAFLQDSQQFVVSNQQLNNAFKTAEDCKQSCLDNCSCNAYAFNSSCLLWNGDVFALQPFRDDKISYRNHLKVAASEIPRPTSGKNFGTNGGLIK
ncbi:G-type lectin S-receptor-like serine/threonine-protein kinase, partial [Thalictrum thalictroides]